MQWCHGRATDPAARDALAAIYHDIRDGLGFRKDPALQGAFPTDPYSHTPGHLGAQQPGMTGQVKEQVLTRFGELGVEVSDGCVRFAPRLLPRERDRRYRQQRELPGADGVTTPSTSQREAWPSRTARCRWCIASAMLPGSSWSARTAGSSTSMARLDMAQSLALFERRGAYRRVTVTVLTRSLYA